MDFNRTLLQLHSIMKTITLPASICVLCGIYVCAHSIKLETRSFVLWARQVSHVYPDTWC